MRNNINNNITTSPDNIKRQAVSGHIQDKISRGNISPNDIPERIKNKVIKEHTNNNYFYRLLF
ncbi:MAG TPA: hypothetical protein QF753_10225 [Victivallales bacterium]|nr:hypothetical protein [Victivallales bacterium]|tara:strand:+ start:179 stop:367 length:189 start_codon:yes stop_codon:yes gene_type:complete